MNPNEPIGTFPDRNTFRLALHYPHPPALVWRAITEPEHLAAWFMVTHLEPRVGGEVRLKYSGDATKPIAEGVVTCWDEGSIVEYAFDEGPWQWPECNLRFEVTPEEGGSRLVFAQRLAPDSLPRPEWVPMQIAGPGTLIPGTCAGWEGFFRESLARHLDGRTPISDPGDDELMAERGERYRVMIEEQLVGR